MMSIKAVYFGKMFISTVTILTAFSLILIFMLVLNIGLFYIILGYIIFSIGIYWLTKHWQYHTDEYLKYIKEAKR